MIKKRQHYVWQRYLKNWSKDKQTIYCLRENKIIFTSTSNLALENYFYKLGDMTQNDLDLVEKGYVDYIKGVAGEQAHKILLVFRQMVDKKELLKASFPYNNELDKELNIYNINIIENFHSDIERESLTFLHSLSDGNCDFLHDSESRILFFLFLSTQYVRTKNMREALLNAASAIPGMKDTTNRIISVIWMIAASTIALQLGNLFDKSSFLMLNNDTDTFFITGDQPVINTKADDIDETTGYAKSLEFYYPISSKIALLVDPGFGTFRCEETSVTKDNVKMYNDLMFANSHEQVFAEDENHLFPYIEIEKDE